MISFISEKRIKEIEKKIKKYAFLMETVEEEALKSTYYAHRKELKEILLDLFDKISIQAAKAISIVKRGEKFDVLTKWRKIDPEWNHVSRVFETEQEAADFINNSRVLTRYVPSRFGVEEKDLQTIFQVEYDN